MSTKKGQGLFITFEGGEGSGKSTQLKRLAARLRVAGRTVVETREPGGTPFAEAARALLLDPATRASSPLAEALTFYAARADHVAAVIRPVLARGDAVLCDRFSDSTRAYQGAASGVPDADLKTLDQMACGVTQPHLTLLLDLDPKVGLARANARRKAVAQASTSGGFVVADGFEGRDLKFHQRLREGFLALAKTEPQRITVLDGFKNEAQLADDVWAAVKAHFPAEFA